MAPPVPQSWERPLLSLAYAEGHPAASSAPCPRIAPAVLERAHAHCAALTALHSHTFFAATRLLPREKRRAMRALCAFCRVSDNIVDCGTVDAAAALSAWRRRATMPQPPPDDLVATAWADTRARFQIPPHYAEQLIDGVARDLRQTRVEAIEPGSFDGLLRYLAEGHHHYQHALQHFVGRNFTSLPAYLSPQNLWEVLFHLHALRRHYAHMGRYFKHPRLKAAFTFQNMYLGLSAFDAPATYSLLPYTELAHGVWFPMGGMYRLVESLAAIAEARGVRFRFDAPVTRISVAGKRATGVILADGSRLEAQVIVANADLPYVYQHLLPDSRVAHRLEHLRYTCSALMFYWGIDTTYPQLGPHTIFLAGDYRAGFDRIFKDHALPAEPSIYVHAPARIDPSAAPSGRDTLLALVPVGHLEDTAEQDWHGW